MKIGILGTSFGSYHAEIYKKIDGVDIVKSFGRNEEKLKYLGEKFKVSITQNIFDIINDPDIDLIDICLPTQIHTQYILEALRAGKNVFCETPLCYNREELTQIMRAEQEYGKQVFVDQFIKFDHEYQYLHKVIKDNDYGKLLSLTITRKTPPIWGSLGVDKIITNLMLHDLDCSSWLLGMPSNKSITAISGNQDEAYVRANLQYNNTIIDVIASSMMPKSYPFSVGYEAIFEKGLLEFHGAFTPEGHIKSLIEYTSDEIKEIKLEDHNPYEYAIRHVIECCKCKQESVLSATAAANSLIIAFDLNDMLPIKPHCTGTTSLLGG